MQSIGDSDVTATRYFGSITHSMGVYRSTSSQDQGILGIGSALTVGQRYRVRINLLVDDTNPNNVVMYGSSDGITPNQSLQSEYFDPNTKAFRVFDRTFVAQYPYVILCLFTAGTYVGATVQWFGLERYEVGVELEKVTLPLLTASKVPILNDKKQLVASGTDASKLDYLDNVGSDIQTQLNSKLNLSGSNANQNIVIGAYKVQSSATPSVGDDYTNKMYVDGAITTAGALYVQKAGDTMTGDLSMGVNKVKCTAPPLVDDDLTRKGYVDSGLALKATLAAPNQTFTGTNTFSSSLPIVLSGLTPSRVLQLSGSAVVQTSTVTTTELGYVSGVTSAIQTQIDSKASTTALANYLPLTGGTLTGNLTIASAIIDGLYVQSGAATTDYTMRWRSALNHYNGTISNTYLFNGASGFIGIGLNTTRNTTTTNLYLGAVLSQSEIFSSKSDGSGYMPLYFTASSFNFVGNVGIGITSPIARLQVNHSAADDYLTLSNTNYALDNYINMRFMFGPSTGTRSAYIQAMQPGSNQTDLKFFVDNGGTGSGSVTERFRIRGNGSLIANGLMNVTGTNPYAVPNGFMAAGSLTIGGDQNYGGGSGWTSNTAGLLMECKDATEIAIHDYGARVVSFMYYVGNQLSIGRNMGWGSPDIQIYAPTLYLNSRTYAYGTINTYSDATNNGSGSHIFVSNQGAGDSYAIMYLNSLGGNCYWFMNGNGRSADGGPLTATLRNDSGNLRLQSSGGNGFTIDAGTGYTRKYGGNSSKILFGPNSTWGAYLVVGAGTNEVNSNTAQVISTNGNLHLDAGTGRDLYINNYPWAAGSVGNIYSWAGDFWTHNGKLHIKQSADQTANFAVANPNGAITHFGYSNNWNYIRGPTIFDTNYVTIGANYSHPYPLWVSTSQNTFWYLAWYYGNGGQQFHNWFGTWPVSIWATHAIVTEYWFGTVSDRRIKTNIKPVGNMLDIINKIEVVSFDFIDPITHKRDECGVIAQQVEEVFPNLVDKSIGVIPNIMKCVSAFEKINETLKLYYKRQDSDELIPTSKVKLILGVYGQTIEESSSKGEYLVQVIDVGPDFIVVAWEHNVVLDGLSVFVYGKQVNDFRNVDKEQLGVMAIKGVQELHSIATSHATLAQEQQKQIDVLTQRNQVLEAHARKLESDFSEYRERTEARLEKIGAILQSLY
jgi:hypothetical protein